MRVALFLPCFNDTLFPGTGMATVRVLQELGLEVVFPRDQTCCGQVHFNTGYRREAVSLMERFLSVFRDHEVVVAPSASCVAMVREQFRELALELGREQLATDVEALARRTFELTELGVEDVGASFPHTVTYHPTCHSIRSIQIGDGPLRLLKAVRGLELIPLKGAEECCGFGGTFALKNADTSVAMMEDKLRNLLETGARVLTAADNSCLMHLAGGMRRRGLLEEEKTGIGSAGATGFGGGRTVPDDRGKKRRVRVLHLAEILASREEVPGG